MVILTPGLGASGQPIGRTRRGTVPDVLGSGHAIAVSAYATTPGRLFLQLVSDVLVALWFAVWVMVGLGVHRDLDHRRRGPSGGQRRHRNRRQPAQRRATVPTKIPLVGDAVSTPLRRQRGGAGPGWGRGMNWTAPRAGSRCCWRWRWRPRRCWLSACRGCSSAVRFARRKLTVVSLARTPAGAAAGAEGTGEPATDQAHRGEPGPVGAWRREEPRDPRARVAGIAFSRRGAIALVFPAEQTG